MTANRTVLFCGAWDEGDGYPRAAALRQSIEQAGHEVLECRVAGIGRKKQGLLQRPWLWPMALWRSFMDRRQLRSSMDEVLRHSSPRCVVVPYPGHHLVAGIKARSTVPVVLDLFLSAYDTVVEDRRLCRPGSLGAWAMQELDTWACASADLVLVDTPENAAYVAELTGLPAERFAWLPLSDPKADQGPLAPCAPGPLQVLFFGTGIPLHGLDTLIRAVADSPEVHLTLVGGTPADRRAASELLGDRLSLAAEFVDRERLRDLMAQCHLVAGVFGRSAKTQRVVPWKVVIALGSGRPVITSDTPAVCGWLDGSPAVQLTPAGDAAALARRLGELAADRAALELATAAARPTYDRHFATARIAERWTQVLDRVTGDA